VSDSDTCPRCGGGFQCGVNDAAPCACTTFTLDAATLAELRSRYVSCLCMACLAELATKEKADRV
jgi:Cysteine-rich CWC